MLSNIYKEIFCSVKSLILSVSHSMVRKEGAPVCGRPGSSCPDITGFNTLPVVNCRRSNVIIGG